MMIKSFVIISFDKFNYRTSAVVSSDKEKRHHISYHKNEIVDENHMFLNFE